jgi:hypothetical protein
MRRHQGDRLGEVHRRAAADGDDAVAALVLIDLERIAHGSFRRVLGRAVIERDRHVAGKLILHLGPQARRYDALVGDDQGPAHAHELQFGFQQLQGTEVELDPGEICDQGHWFFLSILRGAYARKSS